MDQRQSPETICGRSKGISFILITLTSEIKLYVPEEEPLPTPMRYIDVVRRTHTTLNVLPETHAEDYWNVNGDRNLSEPCAGFTQFTTLNEKPPDGHTWSGERLTTIHATSRPDHFKPEFFPGL